MVAQWCSYIVILNLAVAANAMALWRNIIHLLETPFQTS